MDEEMLQDETFKNSIIQISNILNVEKYLNGIKVVIFDMDDTLYAEKEYIKSGYRKIAELFPQIKDAEKKLWSFFVAKKPAIDEFLKLEELLSEENKKRCLQAYRFQIPDIHLYPGVQDMIIRLKKSYKLGLITDGRPEGQNAKIDALGIREMFDEIIITDELGDIEYRKPNEKAFLMMATDFGVKFNRMCYIGDNMQKDFIAPKKLGMRSIWFRNSDGIYSF